MERIFGAERQTALPVSSCRRKRVFWFRTRHIAFMFVALGLIHRPARSGVSGIAVDQLIVY